MSLKDLNDVLVTMPTLEYHNKNWSWTDMLMEVKRDYKNAIVHQVSISKPLYQHGFLCCWLSGLLLAEVTIALSDRALADPKECHRDE